MGQHNLPLDVDDRAAEGFPPADRVRRRAEYRAIQRNGRKVHTPHFVIMLLPRSDCATRLGITVTKRVSGAVGRNRVKRVTREVFRRNRELFPQGCDLVFVARRGAAELGYASVLEEVRKASPALAKAARSPRRRGPTPSPRP